MIVAQNLHKFYGDLHVLSGVGLTIEQGTITAIIGKSGAGKTSLLHILGTLERPDDGTLTYDGVNPFSKSEKELSRFRNTEIGFIFQFHHLLEEFTALENVCIPGYIGNESTKEVEKRAKELLSYLGLDDRLNHRPGELSGGEQQRVAIARALINQPKVIFADEPTGNLDSKTSMEIHDLLFTLRKDFNQTFVIVTHSQELASKCDRIVQIIDGKIISS